MFYGYLYIVFDIKIMNIYNTLYFLEYSKDPVLVYKSKNWNLNLSNNKCNYSHREFDLCAYIDYSHMVWFAYNKWHRLIGPAYIDLKDYHYLSYYIRHNCFKSNIMRN